MAALSFTIFICSDGRCDFATNNPAVLTDHHNEAAVGGMWGCPAPTCGKRFCKKKAVRDHVKTCEKFQTYNRDFRKYGKEFNSKWIPVARTRAVQIESGTLGSNDLVWNSGKKTSGTLKKGSGELRQFRSSPTTPGIKRKAQDMEEDDKEYQIIVNTLSDKADNDNKESSDGDDYKPNVTSRLTSRQRALLTPDVQTSSRNSITKTTTSESDKKDQKLDDPAESSTSHSAVNKTRSPKQRQSFSVSVELPAEDEDSVELNRGEKSDALELNDEEHTTRAAQEMPKTLPPPADDQLRRSTRLSAAANITGSSSKGHLSTQEVKTDGPVMQNGSGGSPTQQTQQLAGKSIGQETRDRMNWDRIVRSKGFTPRKQNKKGKSKPK